MFWDVIKTKSGDILTLESKYGIFKVSEKGNRLIPLYNLAYHQDYRSMYEDKNGNIWVGTYYNGVFRISSDDNKIRHFKKEFTYKGEPFICLLYTSPSPRD